MPRLSEPSTSRTGTTMALACLVSIVLAVLLGAVVNASVSGPVPPEQLFSDSDLVVTGWVIGLNPQWGQGMAGINTIIRFNVDGVAKGELQEGIIEVSIPGGQIGEQGVWVEDQPTFALGEHALLYLLSTGYVSQDGYPRYRLTTGTFMGKSDATGNTTIGVDGKLVPINPLEGLSKGITSVDLSTGVIVPLEPNIQIIGVDVSPYVYTRFPDVNATVKIDVTVKVRFTMNTTWSFPVSINGKETNVVAPVPITVLDNEGEVKTFSTTTQLTGGREAMLNPFASPSTHIDYTIGMGGVERKVSVYAYPDYTYLFVGLGALVVISSAIFIFRVRRTPASFGVKET